MAIWCYIQQQKIEMMSVNLTRKLMGTPETLQDYLDSLLWIAY